MRFCCVLVSLLLVHAVNGDSKSTDKEIPKNDKIINLAEKKTNQYSDLKNKPISLRDKCIKSIRRDLKADGLRKLRQADYFETLADNFADKEFSERGSREQNYLPDDKFDLKYENGVNMIDSLNRPDRNSNQSTFENYDNRVITDRGIVYGLSDEDSPYPMRQERNVFFDDDSVGLTQVDSKTTDLMKLLRRNNDSARLNANLKSGGGVESNTQIPINDDVADFAVYLKKKKKIQTRASDWKDSRPDLIDNDLLLSDQLNCINDDNYKEGSMHDSDWYYKKGSAERSYAPSDKSSGNHEKSINFGLLMKDLAGDQKFSPDKFNESSITDSKIEDSSDFTNDVSMLSNKNSGSYWTPSRISQLGGASDLPMSGLSGISALSDLDGDKSEGRRRMEESHTLGVVRDRMIELPEPLIFNSSHVVSSFVYSMIPFRSPLLNLLESDKHSKYIMIKVDPILQKSGKMNHISNKGLVSVDLALEKNILQFIDKSISSELSPEDENSHPTLEGSPAKARTSKFRNKYRKEENRNRGIDKADQYFQFVPISEDKSDIKSPLIPLS